MTLGVRMNINMVYIYQLFRFDKDGIRYSTYLRREDFDADKEKILCGAQIIKHYDIELNHVSESDIIPENPDDFISFFQERYSVYLSVLYCTNFEALNDTILHTKEAYTPEELKKDFEEQP